jgi:hypothetical protein
MFIAACSVLLPRAIDATSAEAKTIFVEGEPRSRRYLILSMLCFQLYVCQFESRAIYVNQEQNSLYFWHRLSSNQEEDYFRFYHYPDCYLLSTYLSTRARCEAISGFMLFGMEKQFERVGIAYL